MACARRHAARKALMLQRNTTINRVAVNRHSGRDDAVLQRPEAARDASRKAWAADPEG
jgi:hypothetical protein